MCVGLTLFSGLLLFFMCVLVHTQFLVIKILEKSKHIFYVPYNTHIKYIFTFASNSSTIHCCIYIVFVLFFFFTQFGLLLLFCNRLPVHFHSMPLICVFVCLYCELFFFFAIDGRTWLNRIYREIRFVFWSVCSFSRSSILIWLNRRRLNGNESKMEQNGIIRMR